jgi:hypothetical protein
MRKGLTALTVAASILAATIITPTKAEAGCRGCWIGAGIAAGLIGSAIIASSAYGYYGGYRYAPAYYGYAYPAPVYYYPTYYSYAPSYYVPRYYYAPRRYVRYYHRHYRPRRVYVRYYYR